MGIGFQWKNLTVQWCRHTGICILRAFAVDVPMIITVAILAKAQDLLRSAPPLHLLSCHSPLSLERNGWAKSSNRGAFALPS